MRNYDPKPTKTVVKSPYRKLTRSRCNLLSARNTRQPSLEGPLAPLWTEAGSGRLSLSMF